MATFFTSDTHFHHRNMVVLAPHRREFLSPEDRERWAALRGTPDRRSFRVPNDAVGRMDEAILASINAVVGEDDTLYHLGDFCAWGDDHAWYRSTARSFRDRIRCRDVRLVAGNHDLRDAAGVPLIADLFASWMEQGVVGADGHRFFLNHYPLLSWEGCFRGVAHLHGHVHAAYTAAIPVSRPLQWAAQDVGVDAARGDYAPFRADKLASRLARPGQVRREMIDTPDGFA